MHVTIENLSFSYRNDTPVIRDLNMTINKGDIVALVGASGSGKSTLLRLIAGLEEPNAGRIIVNEEVLCDKTTFVKPEHRHIGMVFQNYALFPHMTVGKNILYGIKHKFKDERQTILDKILSLVNLPHKERSYPHELSGGEQQRVALARTLVLEPDLLLLDEPFSNIDAGLKATIRTELKRILQETKSTCLIVTHDLEDAKAIADQIIDISDPSTPIKTGK